MPDATMILQGLNAAKAMFDITKTMVGLRDSGKLLEHTVELNSKIADVQIALNAALSEHAALLETIDRLKKKNARLKTWDRDKKRYELVKLPPGIWVRRLKASSAKSGEQIHDICATCYDEDKKSILQADEQSMGVQHLTCNRCGTKLETGHYQAPQINYPTFRDA